MTVRAAAKNLLRRLVDAVPSAWRSDPVFRWAAIGAGIAGALFLLRVVGPHTPGLRPGDSVLVPAAVPTLSGSGDVAIPPAALSSPDTVPKIAPGHPLGGVTVVPAPDGDRFGTIAGGDPSNASPGQSSRHPETHP